MEESNAGLNLVLLGKTQAGKSSTGNTILGRQAFISKFWGLSVTRDIAVESGNVGGFPVTVYDTPGLFNTKLSEEETQQILEKVLQKCESRPCVFLLVIKADRFTKEDRKTVEKIEELLGETRLKKTWILFTRGDELEEENMTIKEFINEIESLKKVVHRYDQRYHVFNNKTKEPSEQVQELLTEIIKTYIDTMVNTEPTVRRRIPSNAPNTPAASLSSVRIVLLGRSGVGKSAAGNTILQREAFISKKHPKSVTQSITVESGTVCSIPVTVYDTPGLFNTTLSEEVVQQILERFLQECESHPCVFLLVIKADRFTEKERETVEKIEKLLGENRLKKTWILFTGGDELEEENMTIKEFIDLSVPLKKVVQKYDQRYHVFNNKTKEPSGQVQLWLAEIIQRCLRLKDAAAASPASRRIVLLGKSGVGTSAAGNTILGQNEFESLMRMNSVTRQSSMKQTTVSGRPVSVVDTPGFIDTHMNPEELAMEIAKSVYLSSPGPHAFLIVLRVNDRFTEHELQIPHKIEMMFGQEVLKYSIILFTHGDLMEGESVEELIKENCRLRHLVQQCGGRFHVFNNKDQSNRKQVNDLLKKIDTMIEQNGGGHYSNEMYEDAQSLRREEEEQRQREEEERKRQEEKQRWEVIDRVRRETENKIRAEIEAQMRSELEKLKNRHEEEQRNESMNKTTCVCS